jgi:pantothenate synthetase
MQLRDADNLHEVADAAAQATLLAVAAWFPAKDRGTVRLIDNMVLGQMPS